LSAAGGFPGQHCFILNSKPRVYHASGGAEISESLPKIIGTSAKENTKKQHFDKSIVKIIKLRMFMKPRW